ncbi:hypothetical protein FSARC_6591 [Fusarium sarcochroum]|uniref:NACHT domain-containing protein n=1 Tax=Fusarium sarcochroum TaxID=1208366 RepID=A0A8H4TWV6_9HYPO|nr:hypothetical protein FSARC_6591 [Fusarium sarcochroum]
MYLKKDHGLAAQSLPSTETLGPVEKTHSFKNLCEEAIDEFLASLDFEDHKKNPFIQDVRKRRQQRTADDDGTDEKRLEQVRECIEKLEQQRTERRTYRVFDKIQPFLEGLQGLARTCETCLQAAPFGVALAFSGLRLVLDLAIKVQGALSEVLNALDEIAPDLKCYELIASAQQNSPDISKAIKRAYKHILEFWCFSAGILSKSYKSMTVSSLLKPLKSTIQTFRDNIRLDSQQVLNLLSATKAAQEMTEQERKFRRCIAEWIRGSEDSSLLDPELDLRAKRQCRTEGTCEWIIESGEFKAWRDAKQNSVLWYNAPPGTGKSILASTVIDHLQKQPGSEVVYFFYSFSEASKRQVYGGLRSLALQLFSRLKFTPDPLTKEYDQAVQKLKYNLSNADGDLIRKVLQIFLDRFPQIFIVLDGLDECFEESKGFFSTLKEVLESRTNGTIKWFFSSCDISEMRDTLTQLGATEIQPDIEAVSEDIRAYLDAEKICLIHNAMWLDNHEQNFLYARLRCEIMKGRGYTTMEEIFEGLESFPKGLDSCYVKALERIAGRSPAEQKLAKRVFRILIASAKPMTVSELLNALAIHPDAKDHSALRGPMGGFEKVKEVCNPLIATGGTEDFQIVKFYHKSVRDFFLNTTDNIIVNKRLRGFLIDEGEAVWELGMDCLRYLNYKRYHEPLDLKQLLEKSPTPDDHAFLRYAATFWYSHLWRPDPNPEVIKLVEKFLQSPAFWTCIYVQSHSARHLFARYENLQGTSTYIPRMGRGKGSSEWFGFPLPDCIKICPTAECRSLDRSLYAFIQDWGELLVKNPDHLEKALPLTDFKTGCRLTSPGKHSKVRVRYSSELLGSVPGLHVVDSWFGSWSKKGKEGKTLHLRIIREEGEKSDRKVRVNQIAVFPKLKSVPKSQLVLSSQGLGGGWIITLARSKDIGEELAQAWRIDAQNLSIRRDYQNRSYEHVVSQEVRKELGLDDQGDGHWRLVQLEVVTAPTRRGTDPITRLFQLRWTPHGGHVKLTEGSIRRDNCSLSDDSSSDTNSDSASDSDASSDSDETRSDSEDESGPSEASDDPGQVPREPHRDCLVVASDFGVPVWRPIGTDHSLWSRMIGTRHPTLPIVAVSHKPGQIDILNDDIGSSTAAHIVEQGSKGVPKVDASSRELQFSPCGRYLYLLFIAFNQTGTHSECRVTLSTFEFTHQSPSTFTFEFGNSGPSADVKYRFSEALGCLPQPFALTHWTPDSVVLALPPLTYNPKIVKISLAVPTSQNGALERSIPTVSTSSSPVFFPASTMLRNPHITYCDGGSSKEDSHLYLVMDTSKAAFSVSDATTSCGLGQVISSEGIQDQEEEKDTVVSPPVVMRWKMEGTNKLEKLDVDGEGDDSERRQTWREWNDKEDGASEDIKTSRTAAEESRMLRGDLLSLAAGLPTAPNVQTQNGLVVARDDIASTAHLKQPENASILVARALYDQTVDWPVTSIDLGNISFQIRLEKQSNGKYKLSWWNTDPANSNRKIKLTLNSGSGSRIYDIVTSAQTRGTAEITPSTSTFRAIFDQE